MKVRCATGDLGNAPRLSAARRQGRRAAGPTREEPSPSRRQRAGGVGVHADVRPTERLEVEQLSGHRRSRPGRRPHARHHESAICCRAAQARPSCGRRPAGPGTPGRRGGARQPGRCRPGTAANGPVAGTAPRRDGRRPAGARRDRAGHLSPDPLLRPSPPPLREPGHRPGRRVASPGRGARGGPLRRSRRGGGVRGDPRRPERGPGRHGQRAVAVLGVAAPNRAMADQVVQRFPRERLVVAFDGDPASASNSAMLASGQRRALPVETIWYRHVLSDMSPTQRRWSRPRLGRLLQISTNNLIKRIKRVGRLRLPHLCPLSDPSAALRRPAQLGPARHRHSPLKSEEPGYPLGPTLLEVRWLVY